MVPALSVRLREMSILQRVKYKRSKERQGPTLGVCFTEVSILEICPSHGESSKRSKERQGPTLGVCLTEVSILQICPSHGESPKGVKKGRDQL